MSTLENAIIFATEKHMGQVDKAGQPYILHPLRVMMNVETIEQKIVAILHDVLEDTNAQTSDLIQLKFDHSIIEAVVTLTKLAGESRIDAAHRARLNPIARVVKIADVTDNMDLSRIPYPTEKDHLRLQQYHQVIKILAT